MNNQPHGPPGFDREREIEEQHRQRAMQEDHLQREREHSDRQERERQMREKQYQPTPPHQNNTGSIPIHQPVASRLPGAIHSPGGLLANHGGAPPAGPLGAPSGPGNAFGGPLHSEASRPIQHNPQQATNQLQQGFGPSILHHNTVGGPGGNAGFGGTLQQVQERAQQAQQQQQEAVSRLQNALPFGAGPNPPGHQIAGAPPIGQGGQQPILNNRFQDRPEIYKQFLEILQTYQRESKPIQDVYAQVTTLFNTAPDLLEDFKQFLPESAAQAKAAAAAKAAEEAQQSQTPQGHSARGEAKMPPVGSFAVPASATKDNNSKKRKSTTSSHANTVAEGSSKGAAQGNAPNKRMKPNHKTNAPDALTKSPTLTPIMPEPLHPTASATATTEELAFFDRVKKYIGNKQTMSEFLRLCNLFSMDLIDKNVLVHKVSVFIGGNPDLMHWFKGFVTYDGQEEIIDNQPRAPTTRLALSNCRGLGPSYRLLPKRVPTMAYIQSYCSETAAPNPLGPSGQNYVRVGHSRCTKRFLEDEMGSIGQEGPKRSKMSAKDKNAKAAARKSLQQWTRIDCREQERLKPCSGRDEMCRDVLNDDWASHPTWASEDSGFVAHRKNIFEESLHRIEEERHDYDFNIEANAKVIQLLEPIGQSILAMNREELENFRMPIGLGGASQAIYKRVLKKVYGERGPEVVADLFKDPCAVLPIVLARLKQKDEEWRFTQVGRQFRSTESHLPILQREWEKVWAGQTSASYMKSLDHMGIQAKQADKKNFSAKHLIDAIKTKYEENRRQRCTRAKVQPFQYTWEFSDKQVVLDVLRIMLIYVANANQHNPNERVRIQNFFEKFIGVFFSIPEDDIARCSVGIDHGSPDDDSEDITPLELTNGRGRRSGNGKKTDLRRGVLDKGRNGVRARGQKDDSATASKESTPDVESVAEDDADNIDESAVNRVTDQRWTTVPGAIDGVNGFPSFNPYQPYRHTDFNLYANQTIFCFFSIFQTLYRRLKEIKECENSARDEGEKAARPKPARELGLGNEPDNYYIAARNDASFYYRKTLEYVALFIEGELDEATYQNFFRRYYLKKGWQLYTVQDLLKQICRFGAICSTLDVKEKTPDLLDQFYTSRRMEEYTYNAEINARKQADKYVKEQELFLIQWTPAESKAKLKWIQKDETTFSTIEMGRKEAWEYYITSYAREDPTEGVPRNKIKKCFLDRNLSGVDAEFDVGTSKKALVYNENLGFRIDVNNYKIKYDPGEEYFFYSVLPFTYDPETKESVARGRLRKFENVRAERFKEKFEMNNVWMKGLDRDEVAKKNEEFKAWIEDAIYPAKA
ncbi:hypothetical protein PZA11_004279 [Diplocarpon coronariae]